MATSPVKLPPGFVLDQPQQQQQSVNLPAGFVLEQPTAQPEQRSIFSKAYDVLTNPNKRAEFTTAMQPNEADSAGDKFAKGAGRMATSLLTTPYDLLRPATTAQEAQGSTVGMIANRAANMVGQPSAQLSAQGSADIQAGRPIRGAAKLLYSQIPVIGPMVADMASRIPSDPYGVLGEAAMAVKGPSVAKDVKTAATMTAELPGKLSPRGALSARMAETPMGETFSRSEVAQAAQSHGINLDLADTTEQPAIGAVKQAVKRSVGGRSAFSRNTEANVAALDQWGNKIVTDASPVEMNREQTGNLIKQNLLKQQDNLNTQASQYYDQIDKNIGAAKPKPAMIQEMAQQIIDENKAYYDKHPDLLPKKAWHILEDLTGKDAEAAKAKSAGAPLKPSGLLDQSGNAIPSTKQPAPPKIPVDTWSDMHKLRSDLMNMYRSNPDIVGTRAEGWLKQMVGSIDDTMMDSATKLSPIDADLFRKANGIWKDMKGTYDNPQHPFYHVVRAMDGTTAGNAAANLKPEFARQLQTAMGNSFSVFQRDAIARILDPKNTGEFDFRNLNARLNRTDIEKLSAILSPDQLRELRMMNKVGSKVMSNVNPSGTSDVMVPAGDFTAVVTHPLAGVPLVGAEYGTAKAMTSPRMVDFLTKPKLKPNNRLR